MVSVAFSLSCVGTSSFLLSLKRTGNGSSADSVAIPSPIQPLTVDSNTAPKANDSARYTVFYIIPLLKEFPKESPDEFMQKRDSLKIDSLSQGKPVHENANRDTIAQAAGIPRVVPSTRDTIGFVRIRDTTAQQRMPLNKYRVPRSFVRIALLQTISVIDLYSMDIIVVRAPAVAGSIYVRGKITITQPDRYGRSHLMIEALRQRYDVMTPCTLVNTSPRNVIECFDKSYRGSMIITTADATGGGSGTGFTLINICSIENYLRGVVPYEIGKLTQREFEALKAQAIAARTYTYKKIKSPRSLVYDVTATVADQVYDGVAGEYGLCDLAIDVTKDKVITYNNELIYAYYHATCGGTTANVEDVWNSTPTGYLRSMRDTDQTGRPFCGSAPLFSWESSWPTGELSAIITRFGRQTYPQQPQFQGILQNITILNRYACGRVGDCLAMSSAGTFHFSGDKIRFVLRRNTKEYPILPSANFRVTELNGTTVRLCGNGFGHGVGMCQMGAIGRARSGQGYEQILQAYYRNSSLSIVSDR
ncbi:MAG: SpoIID/LytB domain-containing protein [Chitinivibrionales bacterium]|nr:SpoIID/LytB domain-containing protein [Chitinivibrionales bacterium]